MGGIDLQSVLFGSQKSGMFGCGGSSTVSAQKDAVGQDGGGSEAHGDGTSLPDIYEVPDGYGSLYDKDNDGYIDIAYKGQYCIENKPGIEISKKLCDCNDNIASINPGAQEICNENDDNCNGVVDEGCLLPEDIPDVVEARPGEVNDAAPSEVVPADGGPKEICDANVPDYITIEIVDAYSDEENNQPDLGMVDIYCQGELLKDVCDVPNMLDVSGEEEVVVSDLPKEEAIFEGKEDVSDVGDIPQPINCLDNDGDSYGIGLDCLGEDCNDTNPAIYPNAPPGACIGIDYNCDGIITNSKIGNDIRITYASEDSDLPSLIWNNFGYGVGWWDTRDENPGIFFANIDPNGNKIGAEILVDPYPTSSPFGEWPSLVWNGSGYGISWMRNPPDSEKIYFAKLDINGNKIGKEINVNDVFGPSLPSLVWNGSGYGISWEGLAGGGKIGIYFANLDVEGNKIGNDIKVTTYISGNSYSPSLVWNGSGYGISWWDTRDGGDPEIYFTQLDANGNEIDDDIRITYALGSSIDPSLVWNGSGYGVSWEDYRDWNYEIYFTRLDTKGNKVGGDIRITNAPDSSRNASLVWNGLGYAVSWSDSRDGGAEAPEIYFVEIDAKGNKSGSDIRITYALFDSWNHARSLVWNGVEYGISWSDERDMINNPGYNSEIYFVRIGCQ